MIVVREVVNGRCVLCNKQLEKGRLFLCKECHKKEIVEFANEIKEYCKSNNNCYGCAFFDEEVAYEDGCRLNDRPMFWKRGDDNGLLSGTS